MNRNINNNSLGRFLSGKKQDQCGNVTYRAAYVFFEKLRTLEGQKKSAARLKNEREHPTGVSFFVLLTASCIFGVSFVVLSCKMYTCVNILTFVCICLIRSFLSRRRERESMCL